MKKASSEIIKMAIQELNQMPIDFAVMRWADRYVEKVVEIYSDFGRKNSRDSIIRGIAIAMSQHHSSTVNSEYGIEYIASKVYGGISKIDNARREHY